MRFWGRIVRTLETFEACRLVCSLVYSIISITAGAVIVSITGLGHTIRVNSGPTTLPTGVRRRGRCLMPTRPQRPECDAGEGDALSRQPLGSGGNIWLLQRMSGCQLGVSARLREIGVTGPAGRRWPVLPGTLNKRHRCAHSLALIIAAAAPDVFKSSRQRSAQKRRRQKGPHNPAQINREPRDRC